MIGRGGRGGKLGEGKGVPKGMGHARVVVECRGGGIVLGKGEGGHDGGGMLQKMPVWPRY